MKAKKKRSKRKARLKEFHPKYGVRIKGKRYYKTLADVANGVCKYFKTDDKVLEGEVKATVHKRIDDDTEIKVLVKTKLIAGENFYFVYFILRSRIEDFEYSVKMIRRLVGVDLMREMVRDAKKLVRKLTRIKEKIEEDLKLSLNRKS